MYKFSCPYLKGEVELADESEAYIAHPHPDLLPEYLPQLQQTLMDPGEVRCSIHMSGARMFHHWFDDVCHGKYVGTKISLFAEWCESESGIKTRKLFACRNSLHCHNMLYNLSVL